MIYAIGDIHGQHTMLLALLDKLSRLPLDAEDTLVFLGDYVDRGENARAVVDTLLQWQVMYPQTVFLRGNHEQLMLDARDGQATSLVGAESAVRAELTLMWLQNGGIETLLSYGVPDFRRWCDSLDNRLLRIPAAPLAEFKAAFEHWLDAVPEEHWEFLRATQMEYVTRRYHFVHAGLLTPGKTWESEGWTIDPRLWIRQPFLSSRADFDGRIVVFGHTPQRSGRPLIHRNKIGLDTGAVFGGPLTVGIFDSRENAPQLPEPHFIQVFPGGLTSSSFVASPHRLSARQRASSARSSKK
jgi:serine/threonine protein phosphatase 1